MIYTLLKYFYFFILPTFFVVFGMRLLIGKRSLPQRILGLYFIVFFVRNLAAYQLAEASSSYFIHFHYVQSPLHYLLGPLGYLFCLYALKPLRTFKWYDSLHFLPFLLHTIELAPFFFGSTQNKFNDLALSIQAGSYINYPSLAGIIPVSIHAIMKLFSGLIYLSFKCIIWFRFARKQDSVYYLNNNLLIKWIGVDILLNVGSYVLILLQFLGLFNVHTTSTFSINDLWMFLDVLGNFVFFLLYPKLLHGAIFESLSKAHFNNISSNLHPNIGSDTIVDLPSYRMIRKLQIIMEVDAPYLKEDFTIKTLSEQLGLTERNVSKLIHDNFHTSFPDYVASWRLNYLKKLIQSKEENSNFTIEQLAEKSGFGSRQALYKVVQRLHHTTPNKYFEEYYRS